MRHDIGQVIQQNKDKYTPDSKHHQMLREELARANVQGTNGASVDQIQSVVSPILQRIEQLDQRITNNQAAAAAAATPEQEIDVQGNPYGTIGGGMSGRSQRGSRCASGRRTASTLSMRGGECG